MPRSSGTYTAPASSWSPAVNATSATTADWNALLTDVSAALTQSQSIDGQSTPTANWPFAGFKLTGLGAGAATGDSLRWEQLFSQGVEAAIASAATCDIGAANTCFLNVTGTTGIASFGMNFNGPRYLRFSGAVTLTNSASLILPSGANYTTTAGDVLVVYPLSGTGWKVSSIFGSSVIGAMLASAVAFTGGTISGVAISGGSVSGAALSAANTYTGYTEVVYDLGTGSSFSPAYANGAVQKLATNANTTITLPSAAVGKSMVLWVQYGGSHTISFAGGTAIKYASGAAPIATSNSGKWDIYLIRCLDTTFTSVADGGRNI